MGTSPIFCKQLGAQISSMLTYGAEVCGLEADLNIFESLPIFALKRFSSVSYFTQNAMIYGNILLILMFLLNVFVTGFRFLKCQQTEFHIKHTICC